MKQTYTSSKIVSAKGFDGKTTEYMCELTIQPLNKDQFQIVQFSTQDLELNKMCLETFHKLSDENIIYSPNEIQKLTHNNNFQHGHFNHFHREFPVDEFQLLTKSF